MKINHYASSAKINPRTVVLDGDGVIIDFDGTFSRVASDALGRPVPKLNNLYSLKGRYGLTDAEFKCAWDALDTHQYGWDNMPLLPGAAEAVHRLQNHGFTIHLVTGISECRADKRLANLARHGVEVDGIHCVGIGQNSKVEPLVRLRPVMFVDDRLALLSEAGFVPYRVFVDHGDTQDGHVVHEDIIQVRSLTSWVDNVDRMLGGPAAARPRARRMAVA